MQDRTDPCPPAADALLGTPPSGSGPIRISLNGVPERQRPDAVVDGVGWIHPLTSRRAPRRLRRPQRGVLKSCAGSINFCKSAALTGFFFGLGHFTTGLYWISSAFLVDPESWGPIWGIGATLLLASKRAL